MKDRKIDIDALNRDIYLMTVEDPQILDELLEAEGFNPKQLEQNGINKVRHLLFQQTVALKKVNDTNLYNRALAVFVNAAENTREEILSLLRVKSPQLEFNNLEKMDEQDLRDILDETTLLDLMDKINKGEI